MRHQPEGHELHQDNRGAGHKIRQPLFRIPAQETSVVEYAQVEDYMTHTHTS